MQALPPQFFEDKFDAVRHDLCELAQLADQAQLEALAESRTAALEVGCPWLLVLAMIQHYLIEEVGLSPEKSFVILRNFAMPKQLQFFRSAGCE